MWWVWVPWVVETCFVSCTVLSLSRHRGGRMGTFFQKCSFHFLESLLFGVLVINYRANSST